VAAWPRIVNAYCDAVVCRRVVESDLADLLPLVRAYCEFNGVERTDEQLLMISRALIADPDHEGLQIIARGRDERAIGFATLAGPGRRGPADGSASWAICSLPRRPADRGSAGS
jgi:hypothetical protein